MRFVIEEQPLGRSEPGLDLLGKTLVVPQAGGDAWDVADVVAGGIVKAVGGGLSRRVQLPGAGYVEVTLGRPGALDIMRPVATYHARIEAEVHDPEVFELSECFVQWHVYHQEGDNEGDPTGEREQVMVTHIRCDPGGDVDDDGCEVDRSAYHIDQAHRTTSGVAIPSGELSEVEAITSECLNVRWFTDDEEDYLTDCIRDRVDDLARHRAGC